MGGRERAGTKTGLSFIGYGQEAGFSIFIIIIIVAVVVVVVVAVVIVVVGGLLSRDGVLLDFTEIQEIFPQEIRSQWQGNGC